MCETTARHIRVGYDIRRGQLGLIIKCDTSDRSDMWRTFRRSAGAIIAALACARQLVVYRYNDIIIRRWYTPLPSSVRHRCVMCTKNIKNIMTRPVANSKYDIVIFFLVLFISRARSFNYILKNILKYRYWVLFCFLFFIFLLY